LPSLIFVTGGAGFIGTNVLGTSALLDESLRYRTTLPVAARAARSAHPGDA
jgi:nucleoside-diphosphate-sugar epimerase